MLEQLKTAVDWLQRHVNGPPREIAIKIHLHGDDSVDTSAYRVGKTLDGRTRYVVFIESDERLTGFSGELPGGSALYPIIGGDEDSIVTP